MPSGEAFDCREEKIAAVSVPYFIVSEPKEGVTTVTKNTDRPLTVKFRIANRENLGYYKAAQINIYMDNRLSSTISINASEHTFWGIRDGRRTLKLEMLDLEGKLISGTQKIFIFGYQYEP